MDTNALSDKPTRDGRVTVLVSSCDLFYDAWYPFFYFFHKFWKENQAPVRLITNQFSLDEGPVRELKVGDDKGWGGNLIHALQELDTEYVVYIQEDQFFIRPVVQAQFEEDIRYCMENNVDGLTYRASPEDEPEFWPLNDHFGVIAPESPHRVKADPAIWKPKSLLRILRPDDTAWHFLNTGSDRCRDLMMLRYRKQELSTIDYLAGSAIRRDLWRKEGLAMIKQHGLKISPKFRGTHTKLNGMLPRVRRALTRRRFKADLLQNPDRIVPLNAQCSAALERPAAAKRG